MSSTLGAVPATAASPLWDGYCADPFVLPLPDGGYLMYGTAPGLLPDGRAFQVLASDDGEHWEPAGGALSVEEEPPPGTEWWAPEVACADGRYWMYYSRGIGHAGHRLFVAVADDPAGPFVTVGPALTPDLSFAIDASPFQDDDGSWWLFFATDLVEGERPGTVLAVQRLLGMTELTGSPRIILRASADWQRYLADREMYGGRHDWHTLEGPAVVRLADRYLLMYSGGNFQTPGYGMAAASADSVLGPWVEDPQGPFVTSESTGLHGPGHCSLVAPAEGDLEVYLHAWDVEGTRRRPHRLVVDTSQERPRVLPG